MCVKLVVNKKLSARSKNDLTSALNQSIVTCLKLLAKFRLKTKKKTVRGIAQLVEHRSPKPRAVGSNPTAPAIFKLFYMVPKLEVGDYLK